MGWIGTIPFKASSRYAQVYLGHPGYNAVHGLLSLDSEPVFANQSASPDANGKWKQEVRERSPSYVRGM